jgi:hypothetical protein
MRKKLKQNSKDPSLDAVASVIHRIYKKRAAASIGHAEHMVGKTPFETLVRVVLYDVLYTQHMKDGDAWEFPGWEKLIVPVDVGIGDSPSYMVKNPKNATGVMVYLPNEAAFFGDEDLENEQDGE